MEFSKIQEKYELIEEREIAELGSKGSLLRHKATGARVFLIENDDDNKVFYIGFRTPPTDSTGVPHIMEHSVLCGSEAFPVKDPFVELAKGSLNTFLNAMTYPDKTVYPVASCNDQDFKNLMHVYMDAVFHPNIYKHPEIFKQEGWHYELEDTSADIAINGVVYNEMKGAFSSPDDMVDRHIYEALFPDTAYALESGGDPEVIPELTYEGFIAFHQKFYHPSNSYIYLYGNCDMAERLNWLDEEYLSKYTAIEVDSELTLQKGFEEIKEYEFPYSITSDEPLEDNTYLDIAWIIDTALNRELYLAFQILEYALLDSPGAVIKEKLIKEGIGKDVISTYENGIYQPYFSILVKNANASDKERFKATVYAVLRDICENGIDKKALEAGINYFEFKFREADFGMYPKGLMYGLQCLDSWLYDEKDPFKHITATETIEFLKSKIDSGYFEKLIETYLLNNTHAAILVSEPKVGYNDEKDLKLKEKLAAYKASLSEKELAELVEQTKALKEYQEAEDSPEAMMTLPVLAVSDIKKEIEPLVNEEITGYDIEYLYHEVKTNGIGYLSMGFDFDLLPQELLPYAGLLKTVLGIMSTEHYSYADLANEINRKSGGISFSAGASHTFKNEKGYRCGMDISAKFLEEGVSFVFDMIEEVLFTTKFEDYDRLFEIIMMVKSRMQMAMMGQGHSIAAMRAQGYYSDLQSIMDILSGFDYYRFVCELAEDYENKKENIAAKLRETLGYILNRNVLGIDFAGSRDMLQRVLERSKLFMDKISDQKIAMVDWHFEHAKLNEGFKSSSMVQYVAMAGDYRAAGLSYTGALRVLKTIMGYDYLWINARVKGGAYGCFSSFSRSGNSFFVSYRDPNLAETIEIYEKAADYVEGFSVSERDMNKYIIGTISDMDIPLTPKMKAAKSATCYHTGITEEMLQKERDEILTCDIAAIRALAGHVRAIAEQRNICCIGADAKITENEKIFGKVETLL